MRQGASKEKGSGWEREIGRILSMWWTAGERKDVLYRRDVGGHFAFKYNLGKKGLSGDIMAIDPIAVLFQDAVSVEAKFYKAEASILFEAVLGKRTQVLQWWQQCEGDAISEEKVPWLIVKFNHRIPFIMMPNEFYMQTVEKLGMPKGVRTILFIKLHFEDTIYNTLVTLKLEDFLNWCTPDIIKNYVY